MKQIALIALAVFAVIGNVLAKDSSAESNLDTLKKKGQLDVVKTTDCGRDKPEIPAVCTVYCGMNKYAMPDKK
ncbi:MAG: hypothetical protein KAG61_00165 [Bacteriovoracaceae bacterium]|nr:hypothetical protein [Bacteriovoracaceae bacterium]